jgi:hypothetical protein
MTTNILCSGGLRILYNVAAKSMIKSHPVLAIDTPVHV